MEPWLYTTISYETEMLTAKSVILLHQKNDHMELIRSNEYIQ